MKSRAYAVCGTIFCLVGIAATTRRELLPAILMFLAGIACALRANHEWKCEHA